MWDTMTGNRRGSTTRAYDHTSPQPKAAKSRSGLGPVTSVVRSNALGETLQALVDDGRVQLRYHPIAILEIGPRGGDDVRALPLEPRALDAAPAEPWYSTAFR